MGGRKPQPVSVRGGADGIEAHYEDMVDAARLFGQAATDTGGTSLSLHAYLLDPGVYSSGLLDPIGAGEFEAALAGALDGPGGLTWLAAECGLLDFDIRAAAAAYLAADRLDDTVHTAVGGALGLPGAVLDGTGTLLESGSIGDAFNRLITSDPALLDEAVGALGGVAGPLARGLDSLMSDGHAMVHALGADPDPVTALPPRNLTDVVGGLALRNRARHGAIDVRILTHSGGRRSVIVDITGTKSWDPRPNGDITSLATNVRAIEGKRTAYEQGVLTAMQRAGVTPSDQVMLVGHSEGGMVAVRAAIDAAATGRFRITHVVTAGAPIGAFAGGVPSGVQVLAMENDGDIVAHLDGATNPDRRNITTVRVGHDHGSVGKNHSIEDSYLPGAVDVDASSHASVRAFLSGASGFFDAAEARTERYVITRAY